MGKYYILLILSFFSLSILAHNVTNVRGMQEGRNIVLLYDLQADTRISQVYVEIDGKSRLVPNACLSGDVNRIVAKGQNRRIVYDVLSDYTNGLKADRIAFVINSDNTEVYDYVEVVHEYVDLGLSVKWATCNVGASKPEEYGDYFAWGETTVKPAYYWSKYNYKQDSESKILTKYNTRSGYGTIDHKTTLELGDDAARANWGGSWRMPTTAEQDELRKKCTWTWTTQNGVKGYKVTSKKNGMSIFLPATGYRADISFFLTERYGYYWSSSLDANNPYSAYNLYFSSEGVTWYGSDRYYGLSVRPVCP